MRIGSGAPHRHLLVVEAWDSHLEFLGDEEREREACAGLGLPLNELCGLLGCRVTILTWEEWNAWELQVGSPFTWASVRPVTRPVPPRARPRIASAFDTGAVRCRPVPARDPEHGAALSSQGLGPRSHGLLAGSDPYFWVSYCLRDTLIRFATEDPFDAVVLPMWGGLGYSAQLARATGLHKELDVPFVVLATDPSALRHSANQEGEWTRELVVRRQMEDVSLALADGVIAFGSRGVAVATNGRLPDAVPVVVAPRRVDASLLHIIGEQDGRLSAASAVRPFMLEPQQGATGVLTALDAVALCARQHAAFWPFVSAGPDCVFAPMRPRTFREYWSSRGFVRDLMESRAWTWQTERPDVGGDLALRAYPSAFEFLPDIVVELARGSAVILSPAAAEGLAPGVELPGGSVLPRDPQPDDLATALERYRALDVEGTDSLRRELCARVSGAASVAERARLLEGTAGLLDAAMRGLLARPDTDRALRLLLDRTTPLAAMPQDRPDSMPIVLRSDAPLADAARDPTLSTVITCYEMGTLVVESVHSVWDSERVPDELVLVDDGSRGAETAESLERLEREARERTRPLRVVRQENRGLAAARNRGLAEITGTFVSFLDGDDLVEPAFYRLSLPLLMAHPGLGGVAAWAGIFGDGVPAGGWFWNPPQPELPTLLVENCVVVPCVMRTAVLRSLGGCNESLRYNYEDWDLSIRLLASGRPILTIPEYLMRYRTRRSSLLRTMTDVQNQVMRERMLESNRAMVARFGLELAMLTEDRRTRQVSDAAAPDVGRIARLLGLARSAPAAIREKLSQRGRR